MRHPVLNTAGHCPARAGEQGQLLTRAVLARSTGALHLGWLGLSELLS